MSCIHSIEEQKYLCLAEQCIQEVKLMCYKCICQVHQHQECVEHIDDIFDNASCHQIEIIKYINESLECNANLSNQWSNIINDIKNNFLTQIEIQQEIFCKELKKYETDLLNQKSRISSIKLTKDNLQNLMEFRCYSPILYNKQILKVQQKLEEAQSEFQNKQILFDLFSFNINDDLNSIPSSYIEESCVKLEKCQETYCKNYKNMFCVHKNCLKSEILKLQCPQCIVKEHYGKNTYQEHAQHFITADQLFQLQKKRKQEIIQFCCQKSEEILFEKRKFDNIINKLIQFNQRQYNTLQQKMAQQEFTVQETIEKFNLHYQKEGFVIQKDLVESFDLEKQADILQLQHNYNRVVSLFDQERINLKEITPLIFKEIWDTGLYKLNYNTIKQSEAITNPVTKHIQELKDQIESLQTQKQELENEISQSKSIQVKLQTLLEEKKTLKIQKQEELLQSLNAFKVLFQNEIQIVKTNIQLSSKQLQEFDTKLIKEQILPNFETITNQFTQQQDDLQKKLIKFFEQCKISNVESQELKKEIYLSLIAKIEENQEIITELFKNQEKNINYISGKQYAPITCCNRYNSEQQIIKKLEEVLQIKFDLQQYIQIMSNQYKYLEKTQDQFIEKLKQELRKRFEKFKELMHSSQSNVCDSPVYNNQHQKSQKIQQSLCLANNRKTQL